MTMTDPTVSPAGDRREHDVLCRACARRKTWAIDALCDGCRRPASPLGTCPVCNVVPTEGSKVCSVCAERET